MSGKVNLLLIVFIAAAVVAGLFASGVISFDAGNDGGNSAEDNATLLEGSSTDADENAEEGAAAGLATLYGEGDLGAIRMRLLWVANNQPVTDQLVTLHGRAGVKVAEATSDGEGVVTLAEVRPAARYSLHFEGEGFAAFLMRNISVDPKRTSDLGDIMLGERIVVRGRVMSASGKPLPGSSVSVHEIRRNMAQEGFIFRIAAETTSVPIPIESAQTDEQGYFAFATLQDGSYRLVARQGGYASKHQKDLLVNENRDAAPLVIVLNPGASAQGTVKDEEGKPVGGAQIVAVRDLGRMNFTSFEREVTTSDDSGRYVLDTLQMGASYRFGVIAEGYPTVYEARGTPVGDSVLEKDFVLKKGGAIRGTVISKASREPISGAQVAAFIGQFGRGQGSAQIVETDETGNFEFPTLLPGPVMSLAVKAKGYVAHSHSMFTGNQLPELAAGGEQTVNVELEPGGRIEGLVRDDAGTPMSGATVSLRATGRSPMMWTGAPDAVTKEDGSYEMFGIPAGAYFVTASVDDYAPGETETTVEVPEGGSVRAQDIRLTMSGRATGVVLTPAGDPLAGALVRGVASQPEGEDGGNGRGNRGRRMRERFANQTRVPTMTDEKGRFTLKGLGPKMNWKLRAEHDDFVDTEGKTFRVKAGDAHTTEITMLVGASVSGIVIDDEGNRVKNARVQVGTLDAEMARRVNLSSWEADNALDPNPIITNSEGKFKATNLESGILLVKVMKDGFVDFYKRNVRLTTGQMYDSYRAELSRGETVTGTIRGADGKPLRGAWVALDTRQDPSFGRRGGDQEMAAEGESGGDTVMPRMAGSTDADGKFTIERVPPGTYSAIIWFAPGHKSYRDESEAAIKRDVAVPGTEIDMRLEEGGRRMGADR